MNAITKIFSLIVILMATSFASCSQSTKTSKLRGEHKEAKSEHGEGERGEHDRDKGGDAEGEESGSELSLTEQYDNVRNGARLILAYDASSNSFKGTVENTTDKVLERVRVEVHLSNGKELGPSKPGSLKPREKRAVVLKAKNSGFTGWSAHPEVGNNEHGHGGDGERGHDEKGEHGHKGEGERN